MAERILKYMEESCRAAIELTADYLGQSAQIEKIATTAELLAGVFGAGGKAVIFGNGGSASDAVHFAEEFTGRYRKNRPALPVIALADAAHITCVGNDYGFDEIFTRGVEAFGKIGDVAIGLSTSGNSANVIGALEKAGRAGMHTVSLLGGAGGKLAGVCDYEFIVPGKTSDRIQEIHMIILHTVIEGVERILFPENYL